ncbi:MAG: NUDIX hydrolase [Arthrobacter sp.]|uniref:NUDIX hydrolase n=1 Tax=unclassified Arthrobacter TaxID=235627 RepID=UPI0026543DCA|nr:NUDIX domain-containing protein [Micrococcaceae bacterium]MDN5813249.1 NUDIX domain-containing protein [Micrococcaceae bacterium]MDN5824004.1 NUDIX domain-containing protein [Micrococcaceae bacterium]MDN5880264.1 NUDIX domain-containing protein [Micrococcaceae bacterium]MDN5887688.1 NUDIX domain-containing protein [Micrococcaceae bacterium]
MPEATHEPALHGDAATVVLLRDAPRGLEVLLLERPSHRGSFAGAWVFPGGHVDPEDRDEVPRDCPDPPAGAARCAGVRETREETGMVIAQEDLAALSIWTPPPSVPKRLLTWFFLAAVDTEATGPLRLSPEEHVDHAWLTPAEALERHAGGSMELVPPTWMTLNWLSGHRSAAAAVAAARASEPADFKSVGARNDEGHPIVAWAGDEAYDLDGHPGPPGARNRITLDVRPWFHEQSAGQR